MKIERLKEVLSFDEATGLFRWRVTGGRRIAGRIAGSIKKNGYRLIRIDCEYCYAHRLAWFYVYGKWPSKALDHVNRDKTDNRIENLREATASQNGANSPRRRGSSKFKGVHWRTDISKWSAHIMQNRKNICLGSHDTEEAAHAAYVSAALELFGEFARGE